MDRKIRLEITAGAFLYPAVLLMLLPIQWVAAMLFAAAFHELCHMAMISFLKCEIYALRIGMHGAVLETEPMQPWKELLCAIAGPIGSACLVFCIHAYPRLAICGALHCLYNLLPLFPLDGGRVLRSLFCIIFSPDRGEHFWKLTHKILRIVLVAACGILALKCGWLLLLPGIVIFQNTREEKPLANRPFWRYNRKTNAKGYVYDRTEAENSPQRSEACTLHRRRIP